ncbi:MAG TPA: carboxypeptidase-like regulatory domain-containing protein, partial [Thermoanaerobaculia bacterium]
VLVVRMAGFTPVTRLQIDPRSTETVVLRRGGAIRGTVLDPSGKPAPGAIVAAEDAAAETDAAGRFEISGVPPGALEVRAIWKDDYAARRDSVRLKKGEFVELSFRLARAASITGSVLEEGTRRPIAGARVAASSSSGGPFFARRRGERSARADARGRFRLTGLAARPYMLEVSRDGFLPSSLPHVAAGVQSPGSANVALRRAATVTGRALDENGQPVAGARVRVNQDTGFRRMMQRGPAAMAASAMAGGVSTGLDGSFRIRNVAPGRNLELEAAKIGYAPAHRPGLTLKPGDAVKDVALVLRKGLEARGKIVDAQGQPVSSAEVRVALSEGGGRGARVVLRLMGVDREKPDAVSGADGAFVVKGLEAGDYTALVARDGFARKTVPALQVKASGENVWPPIQLTAGSVLAGFVRDSAGQPIAGAQILAVDPGSGARPVDALSALDGGFRLAGFSADRPLMLNVSAPGYAPLQKNVTPPADNMAIVLKTAGSIRGIVEDADTKQPVTDFSISRSNRGAGPFNIQIGGRGSDRAFHSDDGTFELPDVAPGKWTVRASAAGYKPADVAGIEIGEGETKEGVRIAL